ncbi:unnamed protein product [Amoebophrya sp. A25]|nr:unnamed protein product [Amoebophrya sp. A25]|eukprot:GSA25T00024794001.1
MSGTTNSNATPLLAPEDRQSSNVSKEQGTSLNTGPDTTRRWLLTLNFVTVLAFSPGLYRELVDAKTRGIVWEADCNCPHGAPPIVGHLDLTWLPDVVGDKLISSLLFGPRKVDEGQDSLTRQGARNATSSSTPTEEQSVKSLFDSATNPFLIFWLHILLMVPWCAAVTITICTGGLPRFRRIHRASALFAWTVMTIGVFVIVIKGGFWGYTFFISVLGSGQLFFGILCARQMRLERQAQEGDTGVIPRTSTYHVQRRTALLRLHRGLIFCGTLFICDPGIHRVLMWLRHASTFLLVWCGLDGPVREFLLDETVVAMPPPNPERQDSDSVNESFYLGLDKRQHFFGDWSETEKQARFWAMQQSGIYFIGVLGQAWVNLIEVVVLSYTLRGLVEEIGSSSSGQPEEDPSHVHQQHSMLDAPPSSSSSMSSTSTRTKATYWIDTATLAVLLCDLAFCSVFLVGNVYLQCFLVLDVILAPIERVTAALAVVLFLGFLILHRMSPMNREMVRVLRG